MNQWLQHLSDLNANDDFKESCSSWGGKFFEVQSSSSHQIIDEKRTASRPLSTAYRAILYRGYVGSSCFEILHPITDSTNREETSRSFTVRYRFQVRSSKHVDFVDNISVNTVAKISKLFHRRTQIRRQIFIRDFLTNNGNEADWVTTAAARALLEEMKAEEADEKMCQRQALRLASGTGQTKNPIRRAFIKWFTSSKLGLGIAAATAEKRDSREQSSSLLIPNKQWAKWAKIWRRAFSRHTVW